MGSILLQIPFNKLVIAFFKFLVFEFATLGRFFLPGFRVINHFKIRLGKFIRIQFGKNVRAGQTEVQRNDDEQ